MQGLTRCAANSCRTSDTRKLSIELDSYDLFSAIYFGLMVYGGLDVDQADKLWPHLWSRIKAAKSYTVRVNGKPTIIKQQIVNKRVRAKVERMKAQAIK